MTEPFEWPDDPVVGQLDRAERAPRGLMASIEAGELRMEPGEAERRAAAYRSYAEHVRELGHRAEGLAQADGFGDCNIGRLLGERFAEKAAGREDGTSTSDMLYRLAAIADNMAAAHEAAGRAYVEHEAATAQAFRRLE